MSVQNVVLGELIRRRGFGYGYELRDQLMELSQALGYSSSIVYAALAALERGGYVRVVEPEHVAGSRQAKTRVYHEVTGSGETRFRSWMSSLPEKAPLREELLLQLVAGQPEDLPQLVEALAGYEEQCREELRALIERPLRSRAAREATPGLALVQDALVAHLQTMMEWAQRSRASLANHLATSTGVRGRRRP